MKTKKVLLPVLLATLWISLCEFVRNQFWLFSYWSEHYENMGLEFPAEPVNGAIWVLWALLLSIIIYIISQKYSLLQTSLFLWAAGFVLMWLVIGNMGVLPFKVLYFAVPFSMLEVFLAVWIIKKLSKSHEK